MSATPIIRSRRIKVWWEPTYAPGLHNTLTRGSWQLRDNAADQRLFTPNDFRSQVGQRPSKGHFNGARFTWCDFSGKFNTAAGSSFTNCEFEGCDFGTSTWHNVKFTKCKFLKCSFSQSTWIESEFRACHWEEIGISGNETSLQNVYISNPADFVAAAYTNLDRPFLATKNATPEFQAYRLEETKATVSRNIFNNHKTVGDDATFYVAFSNYAKQYSKWLAVSAKWEFGRAKGFGKVLAAFKYGSALAEGWVNVLFGHITKWGSSALRPLAHLLSSFIAFTVIYRLFYLNSFADSMMVAFDITSIAGFTRSVTKDTTGSLYTVCACNLVVAIMFYSAFFSVAINKISRVR